jgi:hypothetical protein
MGLLGNSLSVNNNQAAMECKFGLNCKESNAGLVIRNFLERHLKARITLFLFALLGVSMVIGDGVLTPTTSGITIKYWLFMKLTFKFWIEIIAGFIFI